jgi:hypothetical protein
VVDDVDPFRVALAQAHPDRDGDNRDREDASDNAEHACPADGPLASLGARALNNRVVRRLALPAGLPEALARHCAEEYTNLGALLPELYGRGPGKQARGVIA